MLIRCSIPAAPAGCRIDGVAEADRISEGPVRQFQHFDGGGEHAGQVLSHMKILAALARENKCELSRSVRSPDKNIGMA